MTKENLQRTADVSAESLLIALVFLAPIPLGSVNSTATVVLSAGAAALAALVFPRHGLFSRGGGAVPWLLVAAALVAALPVVPLPTRLVAMLSPEAAALRASIPLGEPPAWSTLSIHPEATAAALAKLAIYAVVFHAAAVLARAGRARGSLLASVVAAGLLQAIYGTYQVLSGEQQILGLVKRYYTDDATGTYINKNHFAALVAMALLVVFGFLLDSAWPGSFTQVGTRRAGLLRALAGEATASAAGLAVVLAVLILALLLSHSRSALASAGLALGAVAWCAGRRREGLRVRALLLLAASALLALLVVAGPASVLMSPARIVSGVSLTEGRFPVWVDSLAIAGHYPSFGTGLGTFRYVYPLHRTEPTGFVYEHAHNDYLELLVETGLAGSAVALVMLIGLARAAIVGLVRRQRGGDLPLLGAAGAIGALLLHELMDFNLHIPANAAAFAALTGCFLGSIGEPAPRLALIRENEAELRRRNRPGLGRRAVGVGAVAVMGLALCENYNLDRASRRLRSVDANLRAASDRPDAGEGATIAALEQAAKIGGVTAQARARLALAIAARVGEGDLESDLPSGSMRAEVHGTGSERARLVEAQRQVGLALLANPTESEAWLAGLRIALLGRAVGVREVSGPGQIERFIEGAILSDPGSGWMRRRIGVALLEGGEPRRGLEQLTLAMRDPTVDAEAVARTMLDAGLSDEQVLAAMPSRFDALIATAVLMERSGREPGAERTFLRAAEINPKSHRPWVWLARLSESRGRHNESLKYALRGLDIGADLEPSARGELLFWAAMGYERSGQAELALDYAERAVLESPRDPVARSFLAQMRMASGDVHGAAEQWRLLLSELGSHPWLRENEAAVRRRLAGAYERLGLRRAALEHFLEALRLDPQDPEAREAIRRLTAGR